MPPKYLEMWKKHKGVLLYLFFGGLTTLINIVVYRVTDQALSTTEIDPKAITLISNGLAWLLAVLFAFFTNKIWVFESRSFKRTLVFKELSSFFACRIATGALDMLIMLLGVNYLGLNKMLVKVLSNIIVVVLNYIFSKVFIFAKKQ